MKKYLLIAVSLMGLTLQAQAVNRNPYKEPTSVLINNGNNMIISSVVMSATGTVTLSTGSVTRSHLVCRNTGSAAVFVTTSNVVTGGLPANFNRFMIGESTTAVNFIELYNSATVFAMQLPLTGTGSTVTCIEEY